MATAQSPRPAVNIQDDLDALIKAARAEGEMTFYTTLPESTQTRVNKAFAAKYGIETKFVRLSTYPLLQRFSAEADADKIAVSLVIFAATGDRATGFAEQGIRKGWVEPIAQAGLPVSRSGEFPSRFMLGSIATLQIAPLLIYYNTDKVKGADIPKDWPDVLNPKWKGQIIIPDPKSSDIYEAFWLTLFAKYGDDFFTRLRAQNPRISPNGIASIQALGAGDGSIALPTTMGIVMTVKEKGGPVDIVPSDYTTGTETKVLLVARGKARHPNVARLFANYVMSAEGNKVLNDEPGGFSIYDLQKMPKQYQSPKFDPQGRQDVSLKLLGLQ